MTASRALDLLNFTPLNNKPIRIMYSHRDPSIRKSGAANIFIKVFLYYLLSYVSVVRFNLVSGIHELYPLLFALSKRLTFPMYSLFRTWTRQ